MVKKKVKIVRSSRELNKALKKAKNKDVIMFDEKAKLYPEHEKLLKESIEEDKILSKIVSSKAFQNMNLFMGGLGSMRTTNIINNLDLNNPKQLKIFIKYQKFRKKIINDFKEKVEEYKKFEKECEKNARRKRNN